LRKPKEQKVGLNLNNDPNIIAPVEP
jgi:hypothetical protein